MRSKRVLASAVGALWLSWSAAAVAMGPTVIFDPSSANPGSSVTLRGSAFHGGEKVIVNWDSPPTLLASLTAGAEGELSGEFQVPAGAGDGLHKVVIAGDRGSSLVATLRVGEGGPVNTGPAGGESEQGIGPLVMAIGAFLVGGLVGAAVTRALRKG